MGDTAPARRIDETLLRRALSRVLVPSLVAKVVDEAVVREGETAPQTKRATPESIERAKARARMDAKR